MRKVKIFLVIFIASLFLIGCQLKPASPVPVINNNNNSNQPSETNFSCPASGEWVDCMPTVDGSEKMKYCSWVQKNCPQAQIAY
jgi:PBP1b-binding outer membrane lipoprotein LpoB